MMCLLLALPRELGDHIYDYSFQEKTQVRALEQEIERPHNRSDACTCLIFYQVTFRQWPSAPQLYTANRQISTEDHERVLAAFDKEEVHIVICDSDPTSPDALNIYHGECTLLQKGPFQSLPAVAMVETCSIRFICSS